MNQFWDLWLIVIFLRGIQHKNDFFLLRTVFAQKFNLIFHLSHNFSIRKNNLKLDLNHPVISGIV